MEINGDEDGRYNFFFMVDFLKIKSKEDCKSNLIEPTGIKYHLCGSRCFKKWSAEKWSEVEPL